jgi:hypothetical protein
MYLNITIPITDAFYLKIPTRRVLNSNKVHWHSMQQQMDHPPDSKYCTCPCLCNGGKWVNRRTYTRHKPHCDDVIARRHEEHYTHVTGTTYAGTSASHTPTRRRQSIKELLLV